MLFGSGRHTIQQIPESIGRINVGKVGAMGAQLAEQRISKRLDSLADDADSQSRNHRRLRTYGSLQPIRVVVRRSAETIQLVGSPKIRRKLFDKLGRRACPIEILELSRHLDRSEAAKPIVKLRVGKGA